MWTSKEVRKSFLEYFLGQGHTIVESSSLVPINDPTLLFTNAGMNQFKDVFLGIDKRSYNRATSSQKCVRAGGKHNDLDTVGRTARHHTFFEMLGNFSFGDYFKKDAIRCAWEFLTEVIGLNPDELWVTIYLDDDEAFDLWTQEVNFPAERILRLGEKDNFWAMGDTGPCGPCSEIHIDRGEDFACHHPQGCALGVCDCDRWLELWNLVFMQYNRDESGTLTPLPRPSIDTGMGLERITSVLQNASSNYDTDLFTPLIQAIEKITGRQYDRGEAGFPFRVIADHIRSCTFLISDGVLPSNDGRGYVLRRILRRAVRFGTFLGLTEPFFYRLTEVVISIMQEAYPELVTRQAFVEQVIRQEEERFFVTIGEGNKKVGEMMDKARENGRKVINGAEAFMLYDTFGFPLDLTQDIAEENGFTVDQDGFVQMMAEQRNRARAAQKNENVFWQEQKLTEVLKTVPATIFNGYTSGYESAKILAIIQEGEPKEEVSDERVLVVFDRTPFYAESGGQVADEGIIRTSTATGEVLDVRKMGDWFLHTIHFQGKLKVQDEAALTLNSTLRQDTERNHSATHLLHKALRTVLGEHAQQKGSLVEPDRLRFDFSHLQAMTHEELIQVEDLVNTAIMQDYTVTLSQAALEEAKARGIIALFGEKYGDTVRIVEMGDYSRELCGGCHVRSTGEIGSFKIISESSIGSGLRRIEAITGRKVITYIREMDARQRELADILKITAESELIPKVVTLQKNLREREKELEQIKAAASRSQASSLLDQVVNLAAGKMLVSIFPAESMEALRDTAEDMKNKLGSGVVLLGTAWPDKVAFAGFASKDMLDKGVHVGNIIKQVAAVAGGNGGGRPDMAQAGGKDVDKLQEALDLGQKLIEKTLQP